MKAKKPVSSPKKRGLKSNSIGASLKSAKKPASGSKKQNSGSHNKNTIFFLVKFFLIFAAANILIEFVDLTPLTNLIAGITGGFFGLSLTGSTIFIGAQVFVITNSCTGLVSASILGAIIFALRKPALPIKLSLFIWGAIGLLLFNIPRITLVLLAAQAGFDAELVHEATWFIMSAIVLAIWYFGTKRITQVADFSELV